MENYHEEPYHLLVVDDDIDFLKLLEVYLKKKNYKLSMISNGAHAINLAKNESFDLILLDIVMPNMNGFEVFKNLKLIPGIKDVPILFLTGLSSIDDIVKGFKLGANDYIRKPFKPEELLARININLELKRSKDIINKKNIELQATNEALQERNAELKKALKEVRTLTGLLPICANCKKIRKTNADPKKQDSWIKMESYIGERSEATFTHGICPACQITLYPQLYNNHG